MTLMISGSVEANIAGNVSELLHWQQNAFSQKLYQAVSETCELLFDVRCIDFSNLATSNSNGAIMYGGAEVKKITTGRVILRLSEHFARKLTRNFYVMSDEEVCDFHIDKILNLLLKTVIGLTMAGHLRMECESDLQCQKPPRNIAGNQNSLIFCQLITTTDKDQLLIEFDYFV
ncbi:MAG: hypothetical protein U9R69_03785 [Thermodesulfobacteriota bacterium]|nr:hypothetical protein [Thermodesulfobacteriota bacterium]